MEKDQNDVDDEKHLQYEDRYWNTIQVGQRFIVFYTATKCCSIGAQDWRYDGANTNEYLERVVNLVFLRDDEFLDPAFFRYLFYI